MPFNCIDPDKRIFIGVSDEEKQMLDVCRAVQWGQVEVQIQDGGITKIFKTESMMKPKGKNSRVDA